MKKIIISLLAISAIIWTNFVNAYSVDFYDKKECVITTRTTPTPQIEKTLFESLFKNSVEWIKRLGTAKQICSVLNQKDIIEAQKGLEIDLSNFIFFYTLNKATDSKKTELLKRFNKEHNTNYSESDIMFNVVLYKSAIKVDKRILEDVIKAYLSKPTHVISSPTLSNTNSGEIIAIGVYNGLNKANLTIDGKTYKNISMYFSNLTEENSGKSFVAKLRGKINSFSIIDIQFK